MIDDTAIEMTGDIVSAFVSHNSVPQSEMKALIEGVHGALRRLAAGELATETKEVAPEPAVPIKKSVHRDHIVCLICGKNFRSMRRHLLAIHRLTPDEYRGKFMLPADYPVVAQSYSDTRSSLAKSAGLGKTLVREPAAEAPKRGRGRPKKDAA